MSEGGKRSPNDKETAARIRNILLEHINAIRRLIGKLRTKNSYHYLLLLNQHEKKKTITSPGGITPDPVNHKEKKISIRINNSFAYITVLVI